jgi:hypothetical protein
VKKILILTADPRDKNKSRLDVQLREIQAGLQRSRSGDQFEIVSTWAVQSEDLRRALLEHEPQIVHFSGQRSGEEGLVLQNNAGQMKPVSPQTLARLFKLFREKVECVVLSGCYSEPQAEAIHQQIDHVVGLAQAIGEPAAIDFAIAYYEALGAGRSYGDAFEFGLSAIDLEGIAESELPLLKQRGAATPQGRLPEVPPALKGSHAEPAAGSTTSSAAPAEGAKQGPVAEFTAEIAAEPAPGSRGDSSPGIRARLFISYKRGVEPDEAIALEIYRALSASNQVFIDQTMPIGTAWAERIEQELKGSDFLITFLSAQSVHSEMVLGEIETAHRLMKESGQPKILPVRLGYKDPFVYPLSAYLNPINWALWEGEADTERLIEELRQAIAGSALSIATESSKQQLTATADPAAAAVPRPHPSAQPVRLEAAEGTMDPESRFYVERSSDPIALMAIAQTGVTITIKGPRQMGKSSLLMRVIDTAMKGGKQVAFLDFQLFDQEVLNSADLFYRQFCSALTEQLGIQDRVGEYWQEGRGNPLSCTRYMQNHILKEVGGPLVLAMDEVDRMFDANYRSDFFRCYAAGTIIELCHCCGSGNSSIWRSSRPQSPIT